MLVGESFIECGWIALVMLALYLCNYKLCMQL